MIRSEATLLPCPYAAKTTRLDATAAAGAVTLAFADGARHDVLPEHL